MPVVGCSFVLHGPFLPVYFQQAKFDEGEWDFCSEGVFVGGCLFQGLFAGVVDSLAKWRKNAAKNWWKTLFDVDLIKMESGL